MAIKKEFLVSCGTIFFLLGTAWIVSLSWAASFDINAAPLIHEGIAAYEKGNMNQAADHFARALLVDQDLKQPWDYLRVMASSPDLDQRKRIQLLWVLDLFHRVNSLEDQINSVKKDRSKLYLPYDRISTITNQGYGAASGMSDFFNTPIQIEEEPLALLSKRLEEKEQRLTQQIQGFPIQAEEMQKGKSQAIQEVLIENDKKRLESENMILHRQIHTLKKEMEDKQDEILEMTKRLIDFSLTLTEAQMLLKERDNSLLMLNEELRDLQSRFELSQGIIQQKDQRINALESEYQQLQGNLAVNFIPNLQSQLIVHEKVLREKNKLVQSLQSRFRRLRAYLSQQRSEFQNTVSAKDDELVELSHIIQVYKAELVDVKKQISVLKERLNNTRGVYGPGMRPWEEDASTRSYNQDHIFELQRGLDEMDEFLSKRLYHY